MTGAQEPMTLPSDALTPLRVIVEKLYGDGQRWIRSISTTDWRRKWYMTHQRRRTPGPDIGDIAGSAEVLSGYISKPASAQTGGMHFYFVVRPDKACIEDGSIAIFRLVLKTNFSNLPQLNFHVWFHSVSRANQTDHHMVGWRFENPEGGDSRHNYFHAQPLRKYGKDQCVHGLHDRFSESFPTIPLPANTAVELCLTAVLVASGKEGLRSFVNSSNIHVRNATRIFWTKVFGGQT